MGDECRYGLVRQVTIRSVDSTSVTFAVRSGGQSSDIQERLLRTFTVPLTEVYMHAIPGEPSPVELRPGAVGALYLSRKGWDATTADGYPIYGAKEAVLKYPDCAGLSTQLFSQLTVIPTSIVMTAHLMGETEFFELELLGPDCAESQDIVWTGADHVELRLAPEGARRFKLAGGPATAKAWPVRIMVHGSPAIDQAVSGAVDILDGELANGVQHLMYARPGAAVTLSLTQDGVNAFHVTPQIVAELEPVLQPSLPPAVRGGAGPAGRPSPE